MAAESYRRVNLGNSKYTTEHRLVWEQHHGPIPDGFEIHHRDRDVRNNRIENLELSEQDVDDTADDVHAAPLHFAVIGSI